MKILHFCILFYIFNIVFLIFFFWLYLPFITIYYITQDSIFMFFLCKTLWIYLLLNTILFYYIYKHYKNPMEHFGFTRKNLKKAIVAYVILWLISEGLMLIWALAIVHTAALNSNLSFPTYYITWIYLSIGLFGNSIFEETYYRGLIMDALHESSNSTMLEKSKGKIIKIYVIQATLFALLHIPNRIYSGFTVNEILISLLYLFGYGIWFGFCYQKTKSLYFVIGLHTLMNLGVFFTYNLLDNIIILIPGSLLFIFFWNRIKRTKSELTLANGTIPAN